MTGRILNFFSLLINSESVQVRESNLIKKRTGSRDGNIDNTLLELGVDNIN